MTRRRRDSRVQRAGMSAAMFGAMFSSSGGLDGLAARFEAPMPRRYRVTLADSGWLVADVSAMSADEAILEALCQRPEMLPHRSALRAAVQP